MYFRVLPLLVNFLVVSCENPEMFLSTPEMLKYWGYPSEVHHTITTDGYILELHRVPHGKNDTTSKGRPVIFLQHALLSSSNHFVANLPSQSPAFVFADAGFDVWMGNVRGNVYSNKHVNFTTEDSKYWDFSWDEIARFDADAMVDYILQTTGVKSLNYVGHSQGTVTMFARLATDHDGSFGKKLANVFMWGPIGSVLDSKGLLTLIGMTVNPALQIQDAFLGPAAFLTNVPFGKQVKRGVCGNPMLRPICYTALQLIAGPNEGLWNMSRFDVYVGRSPGGTSTRNILHWEQQTRDPGVPMYDYGLIGNIQRYGQASVPHYDYTKITYPSICLYWGDHDWLTSPESVKETIINKIPKIKESNMIKGYNHMDFIWSARAKEDVYDNMIRTIRNS